MDDRQLHNPPRTGVIGMALFLASLTMLFIAALLAYAMIRTQGRHSPPAGAVHLPRILWISTVAVLVSSMTIQHALICVQREKQRHFKLSILATLVLAMLFMAIQGPALAVLLRTHHKLSATQTHLYGLLFMLVLLHALHVIGGLIPMAVITVKAMRSRYDHENYQPVRYLAMYWHFLDGVWFAMFATFLALG